MIQRIQSVWLLLASAGAFASLKFSFYSGTRDTVFQQLTGATGGFWILALTIIIGTVAFINIFLFKQRVLQLRLCVLGIVLEALLIYLYYHEVQKYVPGQGTYSLTSILQSAIVIFFILAGRGINKDEKLIKDSDRLR